jgi:hypothetical protein
MTMKFSLCAKFQRLATLKRTKKTLLIVALATCTAALPTFFALAQAPTGPVPQQSVAPTQSPAQQEAQRTAAVILVKNALLAVNQGNLTGNYTVLRDLSSPGFRDRNSAADLAAIFQNVRQQKVDLSALVVLEPMINQPRFNPEGQLALDGYFVTQQLRINFQLLFAKAPNGGWLIHGVSLNAVPLSTSAVPADRH